MSSWTKLSKLRSASGRAAPEGEGLAQAECRLLTRPGLRRGPASETALLEPLQVELSVLQAQLIAGRAGQEDAGPRRERARGSSRSRSWETCI